MPWRSRGDLEPGQGKTMSNVAVASIEPAPSGYVEIVNLTGQGLYLWVAVEGARPPIAREERHGLGDGARRRVARRGLSPLGGS